MSFFTLTPPTREAYSQQFLRTYYDIFYDECILKKLDHKIFGQFFVAKGRLS